MQQRTISWSDCDEWQKVDFIWQLATTSSVAGHRSSKAFPKAKLAKKGHGHCLVVCCQSDPLQLSYHSKTITPEKYAQWIDKMLQKLQCLQPALINNMTPILLHDNAQLHMAQQVLQKLNALGCEVLPHLPYSPDLLPTDYHFFKHLDNFLQGKCFHKPQKAENAFYEFMESKSMDFLCYRNK